LGFRSLGDVAGLVLILVAGCTPVSERRQLPWMDAPRPAAGEAGSRLDAIAAAGIRLQRMRVPFDPANVHLVPREAHLMELKHELLFEIRARLDAAHRQRRTPEAAIAELSGDLHARGVVLGGCKEDQPIDASMEFPTEGDCVYGIDGFQVERSAGQPNLLALSTTLDVACGTDSSLYLLREEANGWRLLLALEAGGYSQVDEALGRFGYAVSPPNERGGFFMAAVDVNPWCSSNWQRVRLRVLRVGGDPWHPIQVLRRETTIYLGVDPPVYRLSAEAGKLSLSFQGRFGIGSDRITREHIWNYAVHGGSAVRIPPIAKDPEAFVDEWIDLPWEEAAGWSDSSQPGLERWHTIARNALKELFIEESALQRSDAGWKLCLSFERSPLSSKERSQGLAPGLPQAMSFTVIERDGAYLLQRVEASSTSRCASGREE
jgi:hypothetical protein